MTICWHVQYGSTGVFVALRYHGSTVTSTVLVGTVKKKYRSSTVHNRPTLLSSQHYVNGENSLLVENGESRELKYLSWLPRN